MTQKRLLSALVAAIVIAAPGPAAAQEYQLKAPVTGGIPITNPVFLTHAGDPAVLYVLKQQGMMYAVRIQGNTAQTKLVLDIHTKVNINMEGGLIGLAFHPDFKNNGKFYAAYTTGKDYSPQFLNVLSEFTMKPGSVDEADPASERVLLSLSHPWPFHHLSSLAFGNDGYLYVGVGDGGSAVDANRKYLDIKTNQNAQDNTELMGSFLRLDVDHPAAGKPYGIPADNPFVGNAKGWKEEIWAYGVRYPWRFSIDKATGEIWSGNVAQSWYEEIQIIHKGANYGWPRVEGDTCIFTAYCDSVFEKEAFAINRKGRSFAIIGGYVYRGYAMPELVGSYLYADYSSGKVWALSKDAQGKYASRELAQDDAVTSFGEDALGNVYVTTFSGKGVLLITRPGARTRVPAARPAVALRRLSPSVLAFDLPRAARVRARLLDLHGATVRTLVDGPLPKGVQTLAWAGTDAAGGKAAPGVYLLSLQIDGVAGSVPWLLVP